MDSSADLATGEKLARLPAPELDPRVRDRVLRVAKAELRRPGEGTLSLRGLGLAWESALAPAVVVLAGAAYTLGAALTIAHTFVG
jgi:hypothetical protein